MINKNKKKSFSKKMLSHTDQSQIGETYHKCHPEISYRRRKLFNWQALLALGLTALLAFGALGAATGNINGSSAENNKGEGWGVISRLAESLGLTEESSLSSLNTDPTVQLSKEYIYAGSRMLAVEDYGLSSQTPTPTPTPTATPTATPTPAKPDLVITGFSITPSNPVEGDTVNFLVTFTNQGSVATNNDWTAVQYKIDGVSPGNDGTWAGTTTSVAPNQSVTYSTSNIPWTATAGSHTLTAFVDDQNRFDESNESNNTATLNINVSARPKPDLIVTNFSISPNTITVGNTVNYSVTIKNNGNADTPNEFISVTFLPDLGCPTGGCPYTGMTGVLTAGQSVTLTGFFNPANNPGSYVITAYIDDVNRIIESNENNNGLTTPLQVNSPSTDD